MNPDHVTARTPSRGPAVSGVAGGTRCASRRAAVRLLAGGALAAPAALRPPGAGAIKGWCRRDPVVQIGERTVQIVLRSDAAMHTLATGPTQLVVTVPAGAATRFLADDPGFGHHGYDVRFTESRAFVAAGGALDVQVEAYAPATDPAGGPLPVVLEFTPRGGGPPAGSRAAGRANEWVRLRATLPAPDLPAPDDPPPADGPDPAGPNRKHKKKQGSRKHGKARATGPSTQAAPGRTGDTP